MAVVLRSAELLAMDPKMLWEMALGLEDPKDIAVRWGITPEKFAEIEKTQYYKLQIEGLRAEMERTGQNFRTKAGVMSQQLMDMIFSEAVGQDTELKNRLEVLKTLARYADWEPKASLDVAKGPAFSISINIPTAPAPETAKKAANAEDIEEKTPEKASIAISFGPATEEEDSD